jgi:hypothetical protein
MITNAFQADTCDSCCNTSFIKGADRVKVRIQTKKRKRAETKNASKAGEILRSAINLRRKALILNITIVV